MDIKASEVGRNLEITAWGETFIVPPLPASKGAAMHGHLMGITFGTFELTPDEQIDLFKTCMGEELFDRTQEELRLPQVQPIALCAVYWNTVGMEAVEAYLAGGVKKALEYILSLNGLQLPTSQSLAPAVTTPSPESTSGTSFLNGGETKLSDAPL